MSMLVVMSMLVSTARSARRFVLLPALLLACIATAQADSGWSTWWLTPDQRGEAALHAGDAAAAARAYTDPRRKAYAQLKAGDYRAAAQSYAPLDDPEAPYNLGNALARAGDLRAALQAYDLALAKRPGDRDAHCNRELIAQALQQQPPQGSRQGQNASPLAGGRGAQRPPQAASGPRGQADAGQGSQDDNGRESPATGARGGTRTATATARPSGATENDAERAQRDAQSALDPSKASGNKPEARGDRNAAPAARTERQLAEDQWLRRLPDDPSGLLRRKFLIQYQQRLGVAP